MRQTVYLQGNHQLFPWDHSHSKTIRVEKTGDRKERDESQRGGGLEEKMRHFNLYSFRRNQSFPNGEEHRPKDGDETVPAGPVEVLSEYCGTVAGYFRQIWLSAIMLI